jgi:hypothetical protein
MNKLIRIALTLWFLIGLAAAAVTPALAQAEVEYRLHVSRDFGYGNGSDVRGNFSLTIYSSDGAAPIRQVSYQIDGQEMAAVTSAPFKYSFKTSSFSDGKHVLSAIVTTQDGRQVTTPLVNLNFVSSAQESQTMQRILIPLMGGVFLIMLIGVGAQMINLRRNPGALAPGAARHYGLKGGTICPRCGRAYAIHFWSLNLIGGALDRCDYCGKLALVRPRSRADLDAAVQAEVAGQVSESALPGVNGAQTEEERQKKMLDESKYTE